MKTTLTLLVSVFLVISACKSADKKPAEGAPAKTETVKPAETPATPAANLPGKDVKWPVDYPVTGDSVAVLELEQEGTGKLGEIVLEFYPDKAPNHVRNFKYLANTGAYNGTKFHRVIKGFMIQGGDPNSKDADPANDGMGGPGWSVNQEFNPTPHKKGILSMARSADPNSAGSQFFICHGDPASLDNKYTVFGNTIKGLDVVDKVALTAVGGPQNSTPVKPVTLKSCKIVARSSVKL
jgi:peptidyl-prolyl cis-trans isomerase B (cyclophilin B)